MCSKKGCTIEEEVSLRHQALHSDYLIRNIDLAFQAWQKPWAKEYLRLRDFAVPYFPTGQKWNRHPI
ncbi:MAG: hypothetical protein ACLR6J_04840 [Parabacteroides merdae]